MNKDENLPLDNFDEKSEGKMTKTESSTKWTKRVIWLIAIAILLFLIAILLLVLVLRGLGEYNSVEKECMLPGCVQQASGLLEWMDEGSSPRGDGGRHEAPAQPCQDFYRYSCGGYPRAQTFYPGYQGVKDVTQRRCTFQMKHIADNADLTLQGKPSQALNKTKTFYTSCTNWRAIEQTATAPLLKLIEDIGSWSLTDDSFEISDWDLTDSMVKVRNLNVQPILSYTVDRDLKNNSLQVVSIGPGELSLDMEKYVGNGNESVKVAFVEYFKTVVGLLDGDKKKAESSAENIWNLEQKLAQIEPVSSTTMDAATNYKMKTIENIQKDIGDTIDLGDVLENFFGEEFNTTEPEIMCTQPDYFAKLKTVLTSADSVTLAEYVVWRAVYKYSRFMGLNFNRASMKLRAAILDSVPLTDLNSAPGSHPNKPSWQECLETTADLFSRGMTALFSENKVTNEVKRKAELILNYVVISYKNLINSSIWLPENVKLLALAKLDGMKRNVGYPNVPHYVTALDSHYENVYVTDDALFTNVLNVTRFLVDSEISRLRSRSSDPPSWREAFKSYRLDATYDYTSNTVNIPAAYLLPPFFDPEQSMALNFGSIGAIMGREVTHALDETGILFDKDGNLKKSWKLQNADNYKTQLQCFSDQIDEGSEIPTAKNNTDAIQEAIAVNTGIRASFNGYQAWLATHGSKSGDEALSFLPGLRLSEHQLFFLSYAHVNCMFESGHSDVNRELSNVNEFSEAYGCWLGDPMNREKKCKIW